MSIGAGILLFAIGAIMAFALNLDVSWIDLRMAGYILMGAGVVVFLVGLIVMLRRRRSDVVTRTADATGNERVTHQSTRTTDDQM